MTALKVYQESKIYINIVYICSFSTDIFYINYDRLCINYDSLWVNYDGLCINYARLCIDYDRFCINYDRLDQIGHVSIDSIGMCVGGSYRLQMFIL